MNLSQNQESGPHSPCETHLQGTCSQIPDKFDIAFEELHLIRRKFHPQLQRMELNRMDSISEFLDHSSHYLVDPR